MKRIKLLSLLLAIVSSSFGCFLIAKENETSSATTSTKAVAKEATAKEKALYFEALGWSLVNDSGLVLVEPNSSELEDVYKGMQKAVKGDAMPIDTSKEVVADMDQYFQSRIKSNQTKTAMENQVKEKDFFKELDKDKNVQKLESGLYYQVIESGSGKKPETTDTVKVHYKGALVDGTEFDSSYKRGEPAEFPLGGVIPAFREGMTLIAEGGKVKLYVPSELGYGDVSTGRIPAGSTLIFDVELLKVNP